MKLQLKKINKKWFFLIKILKSINFIHGNVEFLSTYLIFQKQKGIPMMELIETRPRSGEDSDDEILARRLEYFTKSASCTCTSINKSKENNFLRLNKKKNPTVGVTKSCVKPRQRKEIIMDSQKTLSKRTRSFSGLGELIPCLYDQGECSLEDTCRSPKRIYLDHVDEKDVGNYQVIFTNFALQNDNEKVIYSKSSSLMTPKYTLSNPLEKHTKDDMSLLNKDPNSMNSMDLQCEFDECDNNSNHIMIHNEGDDRQNAKMEDIAIDDIVILQSGGKKLDLPTSTLPKLHS